MKIPSIESYCDSPNTTLVCIGGVEYYYSYETLIAIRTENELVCIKNYWGPTTGKYLNAICPDKSKRLTKEQFEKRVGTILA